MVHEYPNHPKFSDSLRLVDRKQVLHKYNISVEYHIRIVRRNRGFRLSFFNSISIRNVFPCRIILSIKFFTILMVLYYVCETLVLSFRLNSTVPSSAIALPSISVIISPGNSLPSESPPGITFLTNTPVCDLFNL